LELRTLIAMNLLFVLLRVFPPKRQQIANIAIPLQLDPKQAKWVSHLLDVNFLNRQIILDVVALFCLDHGFKHFFVLPAQAD